jgi:hypothetical protein
VREKRKRRDSRTAVLERGQLDPKVLRQVVPIAGFCFQAKATRLNGKDPISLLRSVAFSESLKKRVRQKAHYRCCLCQALADLREDTGRWLRDRNDRLEIESRKTSNEMAARGQLYSGAHLAALAGLKRDALHEYRDEMGLKRRQYRRIRDQAPSVDRYELSDPDRDILASWRASATHSALEGSSVEVDDVTREELEPDLRRFEREGDPPL